MHVLQAGASVLTNTSCTGKQAAAFSPGEKTVALIRKQFLVLTELLTKLRRRFTFRDYLSRRINTSRYLAEEALLRCVCKPETSFIPIYLRFISKSVSFELANENCKTAPGCFDLHAANVQRQRRVFNV